MISSRLAVAWILVVTACRLLEVEPPLGVGRRAAVHEVVTDHFQAFAGQHHAQAVQASPSKRASASANTASSSSSERVGSWWVQYRLLRADPQRHLERAVEGAVAPALLGRVFLERVRAVDDQRVHAGHGGVDLLLAPFDLVRAVSYAGLPGDAG
jgi:hypothetical protein